MLLCAGRWCRLSSRVTLPSAVSPARVSCSSRVSVLTARASAGTSGRGGKIEHRGTFRAPLANGPGAGHLNPPPVGVVIMGMTKKSAERSRRAPGDGKRTCRVAVRYTPSEVAKVEAAAAREGLVTAAWLGNAGLALADRMAGRGAGQPGGTRRPGGCHREGPPGRRPAQPGRQDHARHRPGQRAIEYIAGKVWERVAGARRRGDGGRRARAESPAAPVIGRVVSRPRRPHRLLRYLFGPGRHDQHTNPHLVAAWCGDPAHLEPPGRVPRPPRAPARPDPGGAHRPGPRQGPRRRGVALRGPGRARRPRHGRRARGR